MVLLIPSGCGVSSARGGFLLPVGEIGQFSRSQLVQSWPSIRHWCPRVGSLPVSPPSKGPESWLFCQLISLGLQAAERSRGAPPYSIQQRIQSGTDGERRELRKSGGPKGGSPKGGVRDVIALSPIQSESYTLTTGELGRCPSEDSETDLGTKCLEQDHIERCTTKRELGLENSCLLFRALE